MPEDQAVCYFNPSAALDQCVKHARAPGATVAPTGGWQGAHRVTDNGVGFDASAAPRFRRTVSSKFGLFSIRERVKALGGAEISLPGDDGTLSLPVSESGRGSGVEALSWGWVERAGIAKRGSGIPDDGCRTLGTAQRIRRLPKASHPCALGRRSRHGSRGLRSVLESYDDVVVVGEAANGERRGNGRAAPPTWSSWTSICPDERHRGDGSYHEDLS